MPSDKTKRLYTRNPDLWALYEALVDAKMFREGSLSSRVEKLLLDDVRKNTTRARTKGVKVPVTFLTK